MHLYKNIHVRMCCNRAVKGVEGKAILALRQGKNLSAGLSTSTTGPVHTLATHCILYHSLVQLIRLVILCINFFDFIFFSECLFIVFCVISGMYFSFLPPVHF